MVILSLTIIETSVVVPGSILQVENADEDEA